MPFTTNSATELSSNHWPSRSENAMVCEILLVRKYFIRFHPFGNRIVHLIHNSAIWLCAPESNTFICGSRILSLRECLGVGGCHRRCCRICHYRVSSIAPFHFPSLLPSPTFHLFVHPLPPPRGILRLVGALFQLPIVCRPLLSPCTCFRFPWIAWTGSPVSL